MSHEYYQCLKSHDMEFKTMIPDDFHNENARCHDCAANVQEGEPYVICDNCEFYVCFKCCHKYIKNSIKRYRCFEGHRMLTRTKIPEDQTEVPLNCDKCLKDIKTDVFKNHIHCNKC